MNAALRLLEVVRHAIGFSAGAVNANHHVDARHRSERGLATLLWRRNQKLWVRLPSVTGPASAFRSGIIPAGVKLEVSGPPLEQHGTNKRDRIIFPAYYYIFTDYIIFYLT